MKNLFRIFTFLTLVTAFSIVSANAQTIERFKAEIPFAFNVGAKTYDAGTYVMRLSRATVGNKITLEDGANNVLRTFFVMEKGDAPAKNSHLRFVRNEDDALYLSKIFTTEKSFAFAGGIPKAKAKGGVFAGDAQTVSINLKTTY